MKTELYVIYDSKAQIYNKPFHQVNRDTAIRAAHSLATDPQGEVSRHPEDYALFQIGNYEDTTAQIDLFAQPEHVINFHELK